MTDTMWFERKPGAQAALGIDEPAVLVSDGAPDWVRLPPALGGIKLKVLGTHQAECPMCKATIVRHLDLEQNYGVAECQVDGFVWYRRSPPP